MTIALTFIPECMKWLYRQLKCPLTLVDGVFIISGKPFLIFSKRAYFPEDLVLQGGWCGVIKIIVRDVFSSTLFAGV